MFFLLFFFRFSHTSRGNINNFLFFSPFPGGNNFLFFLWSLRFSPFSGGLTSCFSYDYYARPLPISRGINFLFFLWLLMFSPFPGERTSCISYDYYKVFPHFQGNFHHIFLSNHWSQLFDICFVLYYFRLTDKCKKMIQKKNHSDNICYHMMTSWYL